MRKNNNTVRHLRNERLETIKTNYRGNKTINGRFANGETIYAPSLSKVLKWKLSTNPQREEKEKDDYAPAVINGCDFIESDKDMLVWLGHSSFFIRLKGTTFIVDPVLFDLPLIKRRSQLPCSPEQFSNINYMLLSHGHRDHLDKNSIQTLFKHNPNLKALIPLQAGKLLRNACPSLPYQEAGWYQKYDLVSGGDIKVYFLPASHWHRRGINDVNKVLWGSFLLKTAGISIYFAGDTSMDAHFGEIEDIFGPLDLCIMPVGAYKPSFLMSKSHMNPQEAVKAYNQLRGGTFIPMHYGTFDLSDEPPGEPVRILQQIAAAGILQGLKLPAIGEPILLNNLS